MNFEEAAQAEEDAATTITATVEVAPANIDGEINDVVIWKRPEPTLIYKCDLFQVIDVDGHQFLDITRVAGASFGRDVGSHYRDEYGYTEHERANNRFPIGKLVEIFDKIQDCHDTYYRGNKHVMWLLSRLSILKEERRIARDKRLQKGVLAFYDLEEFYEDPANKNICGKILGVEIGATFISCEYKQSGFFSPPGLEITAQVITHVKGVITMGTVEFFVQKFDTDKKISELDVTPVSSNTMTALSKRGERFVHYVVTEPYVQLNASLRQIGYQSIREYKGEGRFRIDSKSFLDNDPELFYAQTRVMPDTQKDDEITNGKIELAVTVKPEEYWMCYPFVLGFSVVAKQWGFVNITDITSIVWRDDAFDKLVLPDEQKKLVRSLVEYHGTGFKDIIDGKGGGCIFLLHGEPGLGKTLTAEAVAEKLKRPLYSISVGELGTNPDALEKSLRSILDTAVAWNAVLLLDEADIFLEARDKKDIVRNAMVGVFLRLLEYHQGVMFLTTNRVRNIDKAFYSRISIGIKFPESTSEKREIIWRNILSSAGITDLTDVEIKLLAVHNINGRQIKNVIRCAQTLAKSRGDTVSLVDINNTIGVVLDFEAEMNPT